MDAKEARLFAQEINGTTITSITENIYKAVNEGMFFIEIRVNNDKQINKETKDYFTDKGYNVFYKEASQADKHYHVGNMFIISW